MLTHAIGIDLMMQRPHVPKFGAWDPNANAPAYTAVFDQARAGKGGKMVNPNDPAENPDLAGMYGDPAPLHQRSNERPAPRGKMAHTNNEQGLVRQTLCEVKQLLCRLDQCCVGVGFFIHKWVRIWKENSNLICSKSCS